MLRCKAPPIIPMRTLSSTPSLSPLNPTPNRLKPAVKSPSPAPRPPPSHRSPTAQLSNSRCWYRNAMALSSSRRFSGPTDPAPAPTAMRNPRFEFENGVGDGLESLLQALLVVSFYKFADLHDHARLRQPLKELCEELRVSGGIILAPEGINGSICGTRESVERVLEFLERDSRLKGLKRVESPVSPEDEAIHHGHSDSSPLAAGEDAPFRWDHVRVKLKKEIVTLGMPSVSPIERVGKYVSPREWNMIISDPDTVVIDVRNDYETRIGKFKGAVDPCTTAFREFPTWVEDQFQVSEPNKEHTEVADNVSHGRNLYQMETAEKKMPPRVAMYCTGGIRCEKASSFLLSKGFKEVYHLEGGILKYLEDIPKTESLWEGECFVFDKRVSVEHGLVQGTHKLCYGCKQPMSDADMESPKWEYGVTCPYCYASKSEEEKERARARQRQFETWGVIGGPHKGRQPISETEGTENPTQLSSSA